MFGTLFNEIESVIKPSRLCELTAAKISELQTSWRKRELAESSIRFFGLFRICHQP